MQRMKTRLLCAAALVGIVALPSAADAAYFTVTGRLFRYDDHMHRWAGANVPTAGRVPVGGRTITVILSQYSLNCAWEVYSLTGAVTDANGYYSANIWYDPNLPKCVGPGFGSYRWTVTSYGSETTLPGGSGIASAMPTTAQYHELYRAPHMISDNGVLWARRFGTGRYPLFFVEQFDSSDSFKTSAEACGPAPGFSNGVFGDWSTTAACDSPGANCNGMATLFLSSKLNADGTNFLSYLTSKNYDAVGNESPTATNHDFSLWLLTQGTNSGTTIAGGGCQRSDCFYTSGQAYGAMQLAKAVRDTYHSGYPMVIGGYSTGGLAVKVGLAKWCAGYWSGLTTSPALDAGCAGVNGWFAADSPLEGVHIPVSLQRYIQDPEVAANIGGDFAAIKSAAVQEMTLEYVDTTLGGCQTGCGPGNGCDSANASFSGGACRVVTADTGPTTGLPYGSRRYEFVNWANLNDPGTYGRPMRSGVELPSAAVAVGTAPGGLLPECATPVSGYQYWHTAIFGGWLSCSGGVNAANHRLQVNSAGGTGECDAGGRIPSYDGYDNFVATGAPPSWTVLLTIMNAHANIYLGPRPTFVASKSALEWGHASRWNDYWYNTTNPSHANPLPTGAGRTLMGFASEFLHGAKSKPVCGHPYKQDGRGQLGTAGYCRAGQLEIAGNGIDEDGDDLIDDFGSQSCGDKFCDVGESCATCPVDCVCAPPPPPPPPDCGGSRCPDGKCCTTGRCSNGQRCAL
jgi:hypothetical protein